MDNQTKYKCKNCGMTYIEYRVTCFFCNKEDQLLFIEPVKKKRKKKSEKVKLSISIKL